MKAIAVAATVLVWASAHMSERASARTACKPGDPVTIRNVHVITMTVPGTPRLGDVSVSNGRILPLGSTPKADCIVDGGGGYLVPGLADMHAHLPPRNPLKLTSYFLLLNLAHGVTSIRDAGDLDGTSLIGQREATVENYPGPRVFPCGPFVSAGVRKWANPVLLTGPGDAERAAAQLKADGFHCIKAYDGLGGVDTYRSHKMIAARVTTAR